MTETTGYTKPATTSTGDHAGWILHLKPEPFTDAGEPERQLRRALKTLGRRFKLRCTSVKPASESEQTNA